MANTNVGLPALGADPPREREDWTAELQHLLDHAADLSARHAVDRETFMAAAWEAYLDARPGLRQELEDKELRAQLKKLRKQGLLGSA